MQVVTQLELTNYSMDWSSMEHGLSMVHKRSSMMNRAMDKGSSMMDRSMDKGGSMMDSVMNRGMDKRCMVWSWCNIWNGLSFIFDISNKTILMISMIGHNLDTAIGKFNTVFSCKDNLIQILYTIYIMGMTSHHWYYCLNVSRLGCEVTENVAMSELSVHKLRVMS